MSVNGNSNESAILSLWWQATTLSSSCNTKKSTLFYTTPKKSRYLLILNISSLSRESHSLLPAQSERLPSSEAYPVTQKCVPQQKMSMILTSGMFRRKFQCNKLLISWISWVWKATMKSFWDFWLWLTRQRNLRLSFRRNRIWLGSSGTILLRLLFWRRMKKGCSSLSRLRIIQSNTSDWRVSRILKIVFVIIKSLRAVLKEWIKATNLRLNTMSIRGIRLSTK